jgi:hypothetical protein
MNCAQQKRAMGLHAITIKGRQAVMSKGELDSYRQMSPRDVRRWLTASCVVATAFTVAIMVIVLNNFGRGLNSADTHQAATPAASPSSGPSLVLAGE